MTQQHIVNLLDSIPVSGRGNRELWEASLRECYAKLTSAGFKNEFIDAWVLACRELKQINWLTQFLSGIRAEHPTADETVIYINESVDSSPYSIQNWIEAFHHFHKKSGVLLKDTKPSRVFAYLSCCAEYAKMNSVAPDFLELLDEMLSNYGFDNRDE